MIPVLLSLPGCGVADRVRTLFQRDDGATAAVRVADKEFSKADLQRFFNSRLSDFGNAADADKVKSKLLDTLIDEKLLLHEAERLGVKADPQMLKSMLEKISTARSDRQGSPGVVNRDSELERSLAESLKMQQYIHDYLLKNVSVSESECEDFYKEHLGEFVRNDVVHVREILVDDLARAEKIRESLKANQNKNFGELARVYSKAPSAGDGGDLGTFQRGDLPEDFEKAIFHLAPGSASSIVKTQYGFHIFLVEEKLLAHQQKFYEVKEQIEEKLRLERERQILDKELKSLASQIPVEIHRDKLDFNYIGTRFSPQGGTTP